MQYVLEREFFYFIFFSHLNDISSLNFYLLHFHLSYVSIHQPLIERLTLLHIPSHMIILPAVYFLFICALRAIATATSSSSSSSTGEPMRIELSGLNLWLYEGPTRVKSIVFYARIDDSDVKFQCAYIMGRLRVSSSCRCYLSENKSQRQ